MGRILGRMNSYRKIILKALFVRFLSHSYLILDYCLCSVNKLAYWRNDTINLKYTTLLQEISFFFVSIARDIKRYQGLWFTK